MQLRDTKTLAIDLLFPIALIVAGLALATIAIFSAGPDRNLAPNVLYPGIPNKFYVNENAGEAAANVNVGTVTDFLTQNFAGLDPEIYSLGGSVPIVTTGDQGINITQQAE